MLSLPSFLILSGLLVTAALPAPAETEETEDEVAREEDPSEAGVQVLDPVEVQALRLERDPLRRPTSEPLGLEAASSEVTAEDILRQNPASLTEALNFAPGAWTETRGRKVKQFTSFRGQTYPYPDYAIDGLWFREFHELPYFFPPTGIERIEIVRSSAALLTGLSGLAGVINIIPRSDAERATRLEAEYGSYNYQRYHLSHSEPFPGGSVAVSAGYQAADGETGLNAAERIHTGSVRLHWSPCPSWESDTFLFLLQGSRELKRALEPASMGVRNRVQEFDPLEAVLFGSRLRYHRPERATTELSVWGAARKARLVDHRASTTHHDDDHEYGVQLLQSVVPFEGNILRFGGLYHRWVSPDGKRFYAGRRNDLETVSAVIVDQHDFGRLSMDAGYRYSREYINDFAAYNIEGSGGPFRGVAPVENQWASPLHRFNLGGRGELNRSASLYANYAFGQVDAPPGALTSDGDPAGREARHILDGGVVFETGAVGLLKTGLFAVFRDDGIRLTADTYFNDIGLEAPYYENRDSRQWGFEAEWRSPWYRDCVSFFSAVQLMRAEIGEAGGGYRKDPELPDTILTGGVYFRQGPFDASLFGKYVGSYENDRFSSSGPQPLGDYFDLNLTAGYTIDKPFHTRAFVALKNILDDEYSSVVGYYDSGFRLSAGVQCAF